MNPEKQARMFRNLIVLLVVVGAGFFIWYHYGRYKPQRDTLVFERDIRQDRGAPCDIEDLEATTGEKWRNIFPGNGEMAEEPLTRYGASDVTIAERGVSLGLVFRWKNGPKVLHEETVEFVGWKHFEEKDNETTTTDVLDKVPVAERTAKKFCGSFATEFAYAFVVDTTSGMDDKVRERVKPVIESVRLADLLGAGQKLQAGFYRLKELAYQGDSKAATTPDEIAAAINWLLQDRHPEPRSSVLKGLGRILNDLSQTDNSEVYVFTDGLENGEKSVYKDKALATDEKRWIELDAVWNPSQLKLEGMTVILYRMPPRNAHEEALTDSMFSYLADRLAKSGANVRIDSI